MWVVQHDGRLLVFYPRHACDGMVVCHRDVMQALLRLEVGEELHVHVVLISMRCAQLLDMLSMATERD